jgi:hypothetical protein
MLTSTSSASALRGASPVTSATVKIPQDLAWAQALCLVLAWSSICEHLPNWTGPTLGFSEKQSPH